MSEQLRWSTGLDWLSGVDGRKSLQLDTPLMMDESLAQPMILPGLDLGLLRNRSTMVLVPCA